MNEQDASLREMLDILADRTLADDAARQLLEHLLARLDELAARVARLEAQATPAVGVADASTRELLDTLVDQTLAADAARQLFEHLLDRVARLEGRGGSAAGLNEDEFDQFRRRPGEHGE